MMCQLTACSSAVQEPSIDPEQSAHPLPASTETTTAVGSASTFSETTYWEILTTYARGRYCYAGEASAKSE